VAPAAAAAVAVSAGAAAVGSFCRLGWVWIPACRLTLEFMIRERFLAKIFSGGCMMGKCQTSGSGF
jgi:hypothetical protein